MGECHSHNLKQKKPDAKVHTKIPLTQILRMVETNKW